MAANGTAVSLGGTETPWPHEPGAERWSPAEAAEKGSVGLCWWDANRCGRLETVRGASEN